MTPAGARPALASLLLLLLLLPAPLPAATVDAHCPVPWWQMEWNLVLLGPVGQEFTAARDRLSFVDLWLAEADWRNEGVQLAVRIHQGDLTGPVVGTSRLLDLPEGFNDYARFTFGTAVPLTVGELYALEPFRPAGEGYAMVRGGVDDPCPDGRAWIEGAALDNSDLWFQVGWDETVPAGRVGWGGWKARY